MHAAHTQRILRGFGCFLLILGGCIGLLGLAEFYCFPLFSAGGRFHYAGFGFGSFMFGNIVSQIIAYSLIAAIFIPLGLGHMQLKSWIVPLSKVLLWSWLVVGGPVALLIAFILLASKSLTIFLTAAALLFLALSYLLFPFLFLRFYNKPQVMQILKTHDPRAYWISNRPIPLLVMAALDLFYIIVLQILVLFNGIFPLFGNFLSGVPGILALEASTFIFAFFARATLKRKFWSWWGSVLWLGIFTLSLIATFALNTYSDLLSVLAFPPTEVDILKNIPLQGYHLAVLAGIPLVVTLLLAIRSQHHFVADVD